MVRAGIASGRSPPPASQCPNAIALREKEPCRVRCSLPAVPSASQNDGNGIRVFSDPEKANQLMSQDPQEREAETPGPLGSVALAIAKYQQGDDSELGRIVFAFHAQLLTKANNKLRKSPNLRSLTDAEAAVSSAMGSYWKAVKNGRYRDMKHSNELLGLLVTTVERKAGRQIRRNMSGKAGGGRVLNEPAGGLDPEGREPSPLDAAIEAESITQMEVVIKKWHEYMSQKGLLDIASLVLEGGGYRQLVENLNMSEAKARRMITTVKALTRAFRQEENSAE
jgi:hypothetical protein